MKKITLLGALSVLLYSVPGYAMHHGDGEGAALRDLGEDALRLKSIEWQKTRACEAALQEREAKQLAEEAAVPQAAAVPREAATVLQEAAAALRRAEEEAEEARRAAADLEKAVAALAARRQAAPLAVDEEASAK